MAGSTINAVEMHKYLLEELPLLLEESSEIRHTIFRISRGSFADKSETEDRFERMFKELQRDRELSEKRWQENTKQWQENNKRWEEHDQRWEEMQRQSEERWEKNRQEFKEMQRQSDERFERVMHEIKALRIKHESSIGALGARWGIAAESSFRDGLKEILEHDFGVQILNVTEYDDDGEVFGRPDQVELDIIIKNGALIICKIKSSMSRSEMYTLYRKVQFYEKRHQRKVTKLLVISPMVDQRALAVAEKLDITVCSYADEVTL